VCPNGMIARMWEMLELCAVSRTVDGVDQGQHGWQGIDGRSLKVQLEHAVFEDMVAASTTSNDNVHVRR